MTGKLLLDRYLVGDVIGSGGMAIVYKGHDIRSGRNVAIKFLRSEFNADQEFLLRFEREAQAASLISHENLIDVYDVGEEDGMHFIVLEYVDGLTLRELIQRQGALDNYTAISIARQMCQALTLVHGAKIIHRDIKSQNILLDRKGIAKLADFGIARGADSDTITQANEKGILGSVHYFSPEQAKGERATQSSDLYSMGVVLFEMLTGRVPFDGDSAVSIALHHLSSLVPSVCAINPRVTTALDEIVHKAMEKDPARRYQDAQDFYRDLGLALVYPEGGFVTNAGSVPPKTEAPAEEETDKPEKPATPSKTGGTQKRTRRHLPHKVVAGIMTLVLILAGAAVVFMVLFSMGKIPGWVNVPQLVGVPYETAARRAEEMQLSVSLQTYAYDDSIVPGTIIEQEPRRGSLMRRGGTIRVVLCKGPEFPLVPEVVGKTLEEAKAALEAQGLTLGEINEVLDSQEPRGTVIDQLPVKDSVLANGDSVSVTVSMPPLLRVVPDVTNMTVEEATQALLDAGLNVGEVVREHSAGFEVGDVFRQSPAAETSVLDGETVDLWMNVAVAVYQYKTEIEVAEDDTTVRIYVEDQGDMKMIYDEVRPKGTLNIDLNLESEVEGAKNIIVFLNGEEYARQEAYFIEVD